MKKKKTPKIHHKYLRHNTPHPIIIICHQISVEFEKLFIKWFKKRKERETFLF